MVPSTVLKSLLAASCVLAHPSLGRNPPRIGDHKAPNRGSPSRIQSLDQNSPRSPEPTPSFGPDFKDDEPPEPMPTDADKMKKITPVPMPTLLSWYKRQIIPLPIPTISIPGIPCCKTTSTVVVVTTTTVTTSNPTGVAAAPFSCDKYGYLIQSTTLYRVDLRAGTIVSLRTDVGDRTPINAMVYNVKDNMLYARQSGKNALIKMDNAGNAVTVATLPTTFEAVVGDVDTSGRYWYAVRGGEQYAVVDVNPTSANYTRLWAQGITAENNHVIADWTYVPVAGQYLWTIDTQAPGGGSSLMRFSMNEPRVWEVVRSYRDLLVDTFGALYSVNNGTIYASDNLGGTIYGFPILKSDRNYFRVSAGPKSSSNDGARTELSKHARHPGVLARGELLVARVVRVVHVVVDGVKTGLVGAAVTADGAAAAGAGLGGSVVNQVTLAVAATLEGVVQTEPVADLVHSGLAKVEPVDVATGDGSRSDGAAVEADGGGGGRGGEVAVAEDATGDAGQEVQVQVLVGSLAESGLHGSLSAVPGPVGVDGAVSALEDELDARGGVVLVHHTELLLDGGVLLGILVAGRSRGGGGNDVDVGVDGEGALAGGKGAVGGSLGLGDGHDGGGLNQLLAGLGSATAELGVDSEGADGRSRQGKKERLDNVDLHGDGRGRAATAADEIPL
ncbi:hypothetical protein PspLS_05208 [Pyricularia sp. CBS 133598]|nr:hypothetical protein PspLS_05208 [Pyricularia sp. CBS 133598]